MSCIGPLVMEIHQVAFFINLNNASQVFSKEPYVTDSHLACQLNEIVQIYDLVYLHHQWSDEAHTLQFCSTDEYSETVEYEPQTPTHVRDIH